MRACLKHSKLLQFQISGPQALQKVSDHRRGTRTALDVSHIPDTLGRAQVCAPFKLPYDSKGQLALGSSALKPGRANSLLRLRLHLSAYLMRGALHLLSSVWAVVSLSCFPTILPSWEVIKAPRISPLRKFKFVRLVSLARNEARDHPGRGKGRGRDTSQERKEGADRSRTWVRQCPPEKTWCSSQQKVFISRLAFGTPVWS